MTLNDWYNKGMTFTAYRNSMKVNQKELTQVYDELKFTAEDEKAWNELAKRNWRGIVLTADWCGDAALNVPVFQRIAEASNIDLRFLIRDDNLELMDQYLTNGTARAIPIFIFIDQEGNEAAVWGPRSPEVQEYVMALRADLPPADAPDFEAKQQAMYSHFRQSITSDPAKWCTVIESFKAKL
ncbi:thioredoxin family protein [Priestia megaterium]|nr:thioredoxin family protein [Priestia megaterium]